MHTWATIRRAAHQVGEIAARHETGQYSTGSALRAKALWTVRP